MSGIGASVIMRTLGGNRHLVNPVRDDLPLKLIQPKSAAVIGAGIAGLTAASLLADRGFRVTVFEANAYLGGKAGSWTQELPDGFHARIDHGFHGFFRQYFNLRAWMGRMGSLDYLVPIDDYRISSPGHGVFAFKGVSTTPLLNMLSLRKTGLYRLGDMMRNPGSRRLLAFLSYHPEDTFARYDEVSFERFAAAAGIPASMRMMFNTFSRSFFADPDLLSTAELIKSFHFYFLSNDLGLLYDYLATDFETGFTVPARRYLEQRGVDIRLSSPIDRMERAGSGLRIHGQSFDFAVLAADASSSRRIVEQSDFIRTEDPQTYARVAGLKASQGYAVLKVWADRTTQRETPVFLSTDKKRLLDSITLNHAVDPASAEWARSTGGGVFELHSYALPREGLSDRELRDGLLRELTDHLPDLAGVTVVHEHLQVRHDFTAFHTGLHGTRPGPVTGLPELVLAGDWVRLPVPAMLMEAACTSAIIAANAILDHERLRQEPFWSVPETGLFARS